MRKRIFCAFAVFILLLSGCGKETPSLSAEKQYIYYKDQGTMSLYPVEAVLDETLSLDEQIPAVFSHMMTGADEADYTSPIPPGTELLDHTVENGNLILNLNSRYLLSTGRIEVLARAAIVKTFTGFPEISTVEIRIENQPLASADHSVIGPMKGSDFIDPFGTGLNAYSMMTAKLYFANETGDRLVSETREITYSNLSSPESQIVAELLRGPGEGSGSYRAIPSEVKLLSITTKNGVCHVNLDGAFQTESESCLPEITVYSIVDSLTELSTITSVRISVNGTSNNMYMDQIDLSVPLLRNLDYIAE